MAALAGKVALVSGAGKNIGRQIALTLARDGAAVVVNGRSDRAAIEAVAAEIVAAGGRAVPVLADIADEAAVARLAAEAARIKKMDSQVAGDADLLLMPDLNAGNMLYKSFNYIGGGDCAGLVLGAAVPIVLTSRADSLQSRLASVALAVLLARPAATA